MHTELHFVAMSVMGTRLFEHHEEAHVLWHLLLQAVPDPVAVCLMPDHIHLQHRRDIRPGLAGAMISYAQWRNHKRQKSGRVWARSKAPSPVEGRDKLRRSVRYVHLNPCRKKPLVHDPLSWPWSSHRDACGLVLAPVVRRRPDVYGFHRYVSSDTSVAVSGTLLPCGNLAVPSMTELRDAYCAVARIPHTVLERRGPHRTRLLHLLRASTEASGRDIARFVGVSPPVVSATPHRRERWMRIVEQVIGDQRFAPMSLLDRAIQRYPAWRKRKEWEERKSWA